MNYQEFEDEVKKLYYMEHDPDILKLVAGIIVGNRLDSMPIWAMLVAPSGGGKSAIVEIFDKTEWVVRVSSLTPASFASGKTSSCPVLDLVKEKKTLLVSDFSTLFSAPKDIKEEIMSFLRESYGGKFTRVTGNLAKPVEWEGKYGLIGCITPHGADVAVDENASLGERFFLIRLRVTPESDEKIMEAAYDKAFARSVNDGALKQYAIDFIQYMDKNIPDNATIQSKLPLDFDPFVKSCAKALAWARSPVHRDRTTKEIDFSSRYGRESPGRLVGQLSALAGGLAAIGCTQDDIRRIIKRVTVEALPHKRGRALACIAQKMNKQDEFSMSMGVSRSTIERTMEDLEELGLIKSSNKFSWIFIDPIYEEIFGEYAL